jgi:hypothetical protein
MRGKGRAFRRYSQWLVVLLITSLGFVLCPGAATAAGTTTVSVSAPTQPVAPGEQFTVSVSVVPGTAIAGMQFHLSFDPSLATVDRVEEGNLLVEGGASTFFNSGRIDNQAGTVTGVFGAITSPGETVSAPGTFAIITLTARTQGQIGPLGLSRVIAGDINGNPVPVTLEENSASPSVPADTPVFRWWVLSVIVGVALVLITATVAGILFRRHQMVRSLENAGRQHRRG